MLDSFSIVRLYTEVLFNDMTHYSITDESVRIGIESMKEVYKPGNSKQTATRSTVADFNDVAHRCAYLHKYAALHTAMVRDMMHEAVKQNFGFFYRLVFAEERFKICSLGGGPGSDIIGVLAALHSAFSYFPSSVTVVDYMVNWSYSFSSILRELGSGSYGAFGNNTSHFLQWRYLEANLLKSLTPSVEQEISTASLVTMIKFVSAASCKDTKFMVKNIFTAMKPGAVLFFIDNDGGGFRELIVKAAEKYNFFSIFGPFQHESYIDESVKIKRFGSVSCHKTTVSIHILQKSPIYEPYPYIPNNNNNVQYGSYAEYPERTDMYYGPYSEYPERRLLLERRVVLESPLRITAPVIPDNHPFTGVITPLPYDGYFSRDENFNNNPGFYSPGQSTPLTPCVFQLNSYSHVATPVRRDAEYSAKPETKIPIFSPQTPLSTSHRSRGRKGCFPLPKFRDLRRHVSRKLYSIKSHACSAFKKESKKRKRVKSNPAAKV